MAGAPIVEIREPGRPVRRRVVDRAIEVGRECDGEVLSDEGVSRRHLVPGTPKPPGSPGIGRSDDLEHEDLPADAHAPAREQPARLAADAGPLVGAGRADERPVG
jgi:hypothetical protein